MTEIFGIDDPTQMGTLILLAVAITGAAIINLVLRMPVGFLSGIFTKPIIDTATRRRQPLRNIPKINELPKVQCRNKGFDLDAQWDRYTTKLNEAIAASRRAASFHIKATTQLDAAEFAASELFREYPGARNSLNPVIYVEFPALKLHETSGNAGDNARFPAIA